MSLQQKYHSTTIITPLLLLLIVFVVLKDVQGFVSQPSFHRQKSAARRGTMTSSSTGLLATPAAAATSSSNKFESIIPAMDTSTEYTDEQVLNAMNEFIVQGSDNPDYDCRHMFGYKDPDHKLSMLQRVQYTLYLDYQKYMTSANNNRPSMEQLKHQAGVVQELYGPILDLQTVIQSAAPRMALAAEFKRASPSKGDIAMHLNAGEQALKYVQAGADIISCLTEDRWFKGSLQDLTEIRTATATTASNDNNKDKRTTAILRKDFIFDEYQIAEAAAAGADTVLLIVAVLPEHVLKRLIEYCRSAWNMEPLVEVHADIELDVALAAGAKVIGVNNRNLHTFQVDMATSERVAQKLKEQNLTFFHPYKQQQSTAATATATPDYTLCALSGMSTCYDVDRYRQAGLGMCLIGESLMRAADPAAAIQSLCLHPDDFEKQQQQNQNQSGGAYTSGTQLIKVCGITNPEDALVACRAGANLIGVIFAEKSKRKVNKEQAKNVVDAVRKFGERQQRHSFGIDSNNSGSSPLGHLIQSSRKLVETARQRPAVVGVFQNQDPAFIQEMVNDCGLDVVQLHGKEGMAAAHPSQCGGVPAIRVVDIEVDPETGKASDNAVDTILNTITTDPAAILLDTAIKGQQQGGGTGVAFDWSIAEKVQNAGLPVIIAGGLTAESVKECVMGTRPYGVDVSSGVEQAPGQKDHEQVRNFVQGARNAAIEASKGF